LRAAIGAAPAVVISSALTIRIVEAQSSAHVGEPASSPHRTRGGLWPEPAPVSPTARHDRAIQSGDDLP
jgi:hypothetical protein